MEKLPGAKCDGCPLARHRYVPGHGPEKPRAVIIGEAPGADEVREGRPFVGRSGSHLRRIMRHVGIDPEEVYYTNVAACRPPGNKLGKYSGAVKHCRPRLMAELKQFEPPFCALGGYAITSLTGRTGSVLSMRGHWYRKGRVLASRHPAAVLRNPVHVEDLVTDMGKLARGGPLAIPYPQHTVVRTIDEFNSWVTYLRALAPRTLCFDLETANLDFWEYDLLCLGIAYDNEHAVVVTGDVLRDDNIKDVLDRLFEPGNGLTFVGHNVKFDMRWLRWHTGTRARGEYDSMLAHHCLCEVSSTRHALKPLLLDYYDIEDYEKEFVQRYLDNKDDLYSKVPLPKLMEYCALDVCYNLRLWADLRKQLEGEGLFDMPFMFPMMKVQPVLLEAELKGIDVDLDRWYELMGMLQVRADDLHVSLEKRCGIEFNPRSPQQVSPIMYDGLGIHIPKFGGRNYKPGSTCYDARQRILQDIPRDSKAWKWIFDYGWYKSIHKIISSYVGPVAELIADQDGKIHCDFVINGTETGRLALRRPPLHSMPKPGINEPGMPDWGMLSRGMFVAPGPEWVILEVDYAQAEMRTAAGYSNDSFIIEQYRLGKDLHAETARAIYGDDFSKRQRHYCKIFNFASMYGGGTKSFALETSMDLRTAEQFALKMRGLCKDYWEWREGQLQLMIKQGYVETVFGRRRNIPLVTRANREDARKASVNAPIQGTASDLTITAMIAIDEWIGANGLRALAWVILTVHDSVILVVHKSIVKRVAYEAKRIMEANGTHYFPNVVWKADIATGPSWGELEEWDHLEPYLIEGSSGSSISVIEPTYASQSTSVI